MSGRGIFVTGTDTGVGKTVVTAGLLRGLCARGVDAVPMKPVQTGCGEDDDLAFALRAAGLEGVAASERALLGPYRFPDPCSPHLAARRAGCAIDPGRLCAAFEELRGRHRMVLVEGAGGLLVPIDGAFTMLDLAVRLGLDAVLVARPGLGTINHTLLSLRALRGAGVPVLGVIFCATSPGAAGYVEEENRETIARLGAVEVLGELPFLDAVARDPAGPAFGAASESALGPVCEALAGRLGNDGA